MNFKDITEVLVLSIMVFMLAFLGKTGYESLNKEIVHSEPYTELLKTNELTGLDPAEIKNIFKFSDKWSKVVGGTTTVSF